MIYNLFPARRHVGKLFSWIFSWVWTLIRVPQNSFADNQEYQIKAHAQLIHIWSKFSRSFKLDYFTIANNVFLVAVKWQLIKKSEYVHSKIYLYVWFVEILGRDK